MELYLCIIITVIIILAIIGIIIVSNYNKFQLLTVKIKAADTNISVLLRTKYETYNRIINIIKDTVKTDVEFNEFDNVDVDMISNYELETLLSEYSAKINEIIDLNDRLINNEVINELKDESINSDLDSKIKYYNDNVILYNNLIKCFPSNIVAKIYKFKEKPFYKKKD